MAVILAAMTLVSCAGAASDKKMLLELRAAIVYERPGIVSVEHTLEDRRREGGDVVVRVTLRGDPGLAAEFDITPDVAERQPMEEREPGAYAGEFRFPATRTGGPFTVIGRLRHDAAGEVVLRDPRALIVTLPPGQP